MVLLMRSNYGFQGFQFPQTPRRARSVRMEVSSSKETAEPKLTTIDYLGFIAATILGDNEPPYLNLKHYPTPIIKKEDTFPLSKTQIPENTAICYPPSSHVAAKNETSNRACCTYSKANRLPPRVGDRRIQTVAASRFRKPLPFLRGLGRSHLFDKHYPLKKRRSIHCCSIDNRETENVKFRIASFEVPEMFFEISENETARALKQKVFKAVTGLLKGGFQIEVLLKGQHIRDDSLTLAETEFSNLNQLGLVRFKLEPHPPSSNSKELVVFQPSCKTKGKENSERRTRRPFTVLEVEALVMAVERLGTGRWREVKVLAFRESHRTYVDLKDKWKTLVHTASLKPGQRRGNPLPQELLDRVLKTHRYWLCCQQTTFASNHI